MLAFRPVSSRVGDETIRNVPLMSVSDPLVGQLVEQYRVESVVGSGAMGIVYRGVHEVIGKAVAIKVLKPDFADDPEMVQRLVREARTVNAIRHPAIVDIFGFGTFPKTEQPYIVMDLLEGQPLDEYLKVHAPMRLKQMAPIVDEVLSALSAAHGVGVIHRDLKPGNIFVETRPDGGHAIKVIDFGLAKQADRAGGSVKPTNPGTLLGTPAFMAPEQVLGTKVTPATDLYAVGGIAYQLLTNHLPHEGPTAIDVLSQKMQHDPIRPRQWQPAIDEDLDAWVMKLLAREPEKRFTDAEEARRELRRIVDGRTSGLQPVHISASPGSGKNAAHRPQTKSTTGVIPKRDWGEAKTVLTDSASGQQLSPVKATSAMDSTAELNPKSPEVSTDNHVSPWATTNIQHEPPEVEPTAPPSQSPFASQQQQERNARLNAPTMVGEPAIDERALLATPLNPRSADDSQSAITLKPFQEPESSTDPENAVPGNSHVWLYIALGTTILALLLGLAYLFLR